MSFVSVCAENNQQPVALRDERRRLLPPAEATQHGLRLAVPVVHRHRVVVALLGQAVAILQIHHREEEFDPVAGGQSDAPVAVDVVWVDVGEMWAAEVAADSQQNLLAFT